MVQIAAHHDAGRFVLSATSISGASGVSATPAVGVTAASAANRRFVVTHIDGYSSVAGGLVTIVGSGGTTYYQTRVGAGNFERNFNPGLLCVGGVSGERLAFGVAPTATAYADINAVGYYEFAG